MASSLNNFDLEYYASAIADKVKTRLALKQDTLQLDAAPTANSTKFVNSGAIYEALQNTPGAFIGTTAEWNALTTSEKAAYTLVYLTDDGIGDGGSGGGSRLFVDDNGYISIDYEGISGEASGESSGGSVAVVGSIISVITEESNLFGREVTISDGANSITRTFSDSGIATFSGITLTGNLTISATNSSNVTITTTCEVPYFGSYKIYFGSVVNTINITTDEPTLYGKTVTISNGTKSKTATIGSDGKVSVMVFFGGDLAISASDGSEETTAEITTTSGTTSYNVELSFVKIYGVSWAGTSSPIMTRTDAAASFSDPSPAVNNGNGSSPFDDILPWSGMEIVDDATAGKLVKIPKYYYKWTKTGSAMTLQISATEFDGSHVSPAHADRGDGKGERDVVYVGRYHCATSTYKSTTGVKPANNLTRSEFRTNIHNLGSTYWQFDYAMLWTIRMLYLVEYANWNSQAKIGYGCGNNSSAENAGLTDAMTYHTGTNAANRTTYGHTQYRHIEDLWGNVYDWCDGIYFATADVYVINNPSSFSDTTGGTKVGTRPTTSNDIKSFFVPSATGLEWALYPDDVVSDSNYETYVCDYCSYNASGVVLFVGGYYSQYQYYGAFYLSGGNQASSKGTNLGSRLMKLA